MNQAQYLQRVLETSLRGKTAHRWRFGVPLQTRNVVAESFAYLRQGFELIETEMTARALRLNTFPEEANDVMEVMEELLLVLEQTRHYPGT